MLFFDAWNDQQRGVTTGACQQDHNYLGGVGVSYSGCRHADINNFLICLFSKRLPVSGILVKCFFLLPAC